MGSNLSWASQIPTPVTTASDLVAVLVMPAGAKHNRHPRHRRPPPAGASLVLFTQTHPCRPMSPPASRVMDGNFLLMVARAPGQGLALRERSRSPWSRRLVCTLFLCRACARNRPDDRFGYVSLEVMQRSGRARTCANGGLAQAGARLWTTCRRRSPEPLIWSASSPDIAHRVLNNQPAASIVHNSVLESTRPRHPRRPVRT